MSLAFVGTNYLFNGSIVLPTTGYPVTVGMWVNSFGLGSAETLWSYSDTGSANNYLGMRLTSTGALQVTARAGATENNAATTNVVPVSVGETWAFCLGRFVSSSYRAVHMFSPNSTVIFGSNSTTTARAPTGLDSESIGSLVTSGGVLEPFAGGIAEFWKCDADIFPGNYTAGLDHAVASIAMNGPFSLPNIGKNLIEYFSFRRGIGASAFTFDGDDVYHGRFGQTFWAVSDGTDLLPFLHPSLPYYYRKPYDHRAPFLV